MSIRAYVNPRRLDQRVRLERFTDGQDDEGDLNPTWSTMLECRAAVDAMRAKERFVEGATRSIGAMTVWIRAEVVERVRLVRTDRLVWLRRPGDEVVMNIEDIPDQQRRGRLIAVFVNTGLNNG